MSPFLARAGALLAVILVLASSTSAAQRRNTVPAPENGGFTKSMGLTNPYRITTGLDVQFHRPSGYDSQTEFLGNFGATRVFGNPTIGIAGLGAEGYLGARAGDVNAGFRLSLRVPVLQLAFGYDRNSTEEEDDFYVQLGNPGRRGGILGGGSSWIVRYIPTRDHTWGLGVSFPISNQHAGKTRPKYDYIKFETKYPERMEEGQVSLDEPLRDLCGQLDERAHWIARLSQPFAEESGGDAVKAVGGIFDSLHAHVVGTDALFPDGHTLPEEIRMFHELLDRACSVALSREPAAGTTADGRRAAEAARRYLLQGILFPYNLEFGQQRRNDTLTSLRAGAQSDFAKWVLTELDQPLEDQRRCYWIFQSLCDTLEEVRKALHDRWGDTRLVWLPLHYGLRAEDHDTQSELNDILEQATGERFHAGNRFFYVINEQFQWEMARSVRAAEDYHVLWIHDVAGKNHHGDPDGLAYGQVVNYFEAMIERVKAYDETGKLPMYIIFLDQFYYEINDGDRWMKILQKPRRAPIDLPGDFQEWEDRLKDLQQQLRDAVDESWLLQVEKSQFGEDWLRNRIKVHVNITNPNDDSFRSLYVIGKLPVPDSNMRDHRKIIFYDVSEEDPYRGMAMFTGMGLGEHYIGPGWEDRAVIVQGPAALPVKEAARDLLTIQGFEPQENDDKVDAEMGKQPSWLQEDGAGIMQLHSETGFVRKPINVAKGVLYSLMPPGSVLKVPDSLWQSNIFASLMAGSALRGCRVMVIAPTRDSAPSAGNPQMARAHGLTSRLIVFQQKMDDLAEAEGGILRVGLYAPRQGVGDIAGRLQQGLDLDVPWKKRVYDFDPANREVVQNAAKQLADLGYTPQYLREEGHENTAKLHLKANYFASRRAWDDVMSRPEWADVLKEYIAYLADQQVVTAEEESKPNAMSAPDELQRAAVSLVDSFTKGKSEEEIDELIFYITVGSVNMDYRSQVMNGEVMVLVSGLKALNGVLDFVVISGLCEWPETQEELDALLAPPSWFQRKMADFVKFAL
jgi:hypothetical protein